MVLSPKQREDRYAHITAFYNSIVHGTPPLVDVRVGAAAALTSQLGHEAKMQQKVVNSVKATTEARQWRVRGESLCDADYRSETKHDALDMPRSLGVLFVKAESSRGTGKWRETIFREVWTC
jgi:hypothetical protein